MFGRELSHLRRLQVIVAVLSGFAMVAAVLSACGGPEATQVANAPVVATAAAAPATASSLAAVSTPVSTPVPQATSGEKIKIGFIALTDAASVIIAKEKGFFDKYGLNVELVKQASWAATRDNLLTGEIHAAHTLFGMPFSVYTGVGGAAGKQIDIAMVLSNNGQGITLSKQGFEGKVGYRDLTGLKSAVEALQAKKEVTFAMTFPGGTHDIWLRYWLAASGVDQKTVKIITVPPPQMVANMKVGNMDGYSVGEPWNGVGVKESIGFTTITSQDVWQHHPEKVLGVNHDFAQKRRPDLKLVMRAVLEASQFVEDPKNTAEVARTIGATAYVNAPADVIDARLSGDFELGGNLGRKLFTDDSMRFFKADGTVNAPRPAHAIWFMAQFVRFGYLKEMPSDARAIAEKIILSDLYREVAHEMDIPVPDDGMAPFTVQLDNARFDPADPAAYLKAYGGP
jgi:nitrate/nitrite transport system substrate-binding protein